MVVSYNICNVVTLLFGLVLDVEEQLQAADSRCELLDKQLEYMRRMLNEAEAEKRLAYERTEQMIQLRNANTGQEMRSQMDKISDMEREHHRLQASQAVAQVTKFQVSALFLVRPPSTFS